MGHRIGKKEYQGTLTEVARMKKVWYFLYFGWTCGWSDKWFPWAVGPFPLWAYCVSEFLHRKWLEDSWDL